MRLWRDTSAFPAHLRHVRPHEGGSGEGLPRCGGERLEDVRATSVREREERIAALEDRLREQRLRARMGSQPSDAERARARMGHGMLVDRPEHNVVLVPAGSRVTPISPGLALVEQDDEPTDYASAYRWLLSNQRYVDQMGPYSRPPDAISITLNGETKTFPRPSPRGAPLDAPAPPVRK